MKGQGFFVQKVFAKIFIHGFSVGSNVDLETESSIMVEIKS